MIKIAMNPVVEIPLTDIIISKVNMRSMYDPEAIDNLNNSIGQYGQIYPILLHRLRSNVNKFELIIGSRRFKAAQKGHRYTIPAVILDDISEPDMVVISLMENLHREDLTPFEEANAILALSTKHRMSLKEIAKKVNRPVRWVSGRLKILSVPETVQNLLCKNRVTLNHVGILASLRKPKDQIRYAKVIAKQALSEEDLVTLIRHEAAVKGVKPEVCTERLASNELFTPMRTALKIRYFGKFLVNKVRPQLALEGSEIIKVKEALREVQVIIKDMLDQSKKWPKF